MNPQPQPIAEWRDVDEATFARDVVSRYQPAVLRGVVAHWPAVRHGQESPDAFHRYVTAFDSGVPVDGILMRPQENPRFKDALAAAQVAELGPGDALFIPTLWWHHVESLDAKLNVLVNYWWNGSLGAVERTASALDSLLHCLLDLGPLPPELRQAWGAFFDHYVFHAGPDTVAHIPAQRRGVVGPLTPEMAQRIREHLIAALQR